MSSVEGATRQPRSWRCWCGEWISDRGGGAGARAECTDCDLVGNALNGADIQSGGMVRLVGNRISKNQQTGVLVADSLSFVHVRDPRPRVVFGVSGLC